MCGGLGEGQGMPLNIVGAELSAGGLPGAGGIVFLLLAFQLIPDLGIF